jgi:hypothetical protein
MEKIIGALTAAIFYLMKLFDRSQEGDHHAIKTRKFKIERIVYHICPLQLF